MFDLSLILLLALSLIPFVWAHPGEHHDAQSIAAEIRKRDYYGGHTQRSLAECQRHPNYKTLQRNSIDRRSKKAKGLRKKRGIDVSRSYPTSFHTRRDSIALDHFAGSNHNMTSQNFNLNTDLSQLFANYENSSCILTPEITQGPYYVKGEYFRSSVAEGQGGVPVHLEYQYIDIATCAPAAGLFIETWSANATGVYSGVATPGNGNSQDQSNLDTTFLRGITETDVDGVGCFDTIYPGHYTGRSNHIHIMTHHDGQVLANGTYKGGNMTHVGQLFFPEDLTDAVEGTEHYTSNTQRRTSNDRDFFAKTQADNNYDPFPEYVYLGNSITDGLLMWISIGVNMSASYAEDMPFGATLTDAGGVSNPNAVTFGPGSNSTNATTMPPTSLN